MTVNARELRHRRGELIDKAQEMVKNAEIEDRDFTDEEQTKYDDMLAQADQMENRAKRLENMEGLRGAVDAKKAPAFNKTKPGETEERAYAHFIRTGDTSAIKEFRASNDTDMNIGTDADGGYAVPTGHYNNIIARRDEMALDAKLGMVNMGGEGTTLNVPIDNEADGEFVVTNEGSDHDRDAPALDQKALTYLRYTKKIQLSWELLWDETSNLMGFIENFVGRGMAKTNNNLLLTEVAANGTALKTFASATAIAVDELEPITYNDALEPYLDDSAACAWVMRRSVHGEIALLDDANTRRYANNQMGNEMGPNLLGFPIAYSVKSGATAASTKSVYFGNWNYVGYRMAPTMHFIRDPYSYEAGIELRYQYRVVYGVLQAEAIGYGVHPSA